MIRLLDDRRRPTTAGLMVAIAVVGLVLGLGVSLNRVWPEVMERRRAARFEGSEAARWRRVADLSERGRVLVTRLPMTSGWKEILAGQGYDVDRPFHYRYEVLSSRVRHSLVVRRSSEADRAELTAICLERAKYHERMRRALVRAAWLPWTLIEEIDVPPKPPVEGDVSDQSY